jgi:exosortase A-associated hydrolase 2
MEEGLEKIFFFPGSSKRRLLGIIYYPEPLIALRTGIIYCHPFAEEQNMSHSVAVKACRAFARIGHPVLRFDMSGCGDSEGSLDDMSVQSWMEDINAAIEVMKCESNVQHVALFGLRLGGGLALLHSAVHETATPFLILWEPVLDFTVFIRQFLKRNIVSQIVANTSDGTTVSGLERHLIDEGKVEVIGYPITKGLYDSFCAVSEKPMNYQPLCPGLVLSISQMDKPSAQLIRYRDSLKSIQRDFMFDHVSAEPFWDRYWRWECPEAVQRTVRWLTENR